MFLPLIGLLVGTAGADPIPTYTLSDDTSIWDRLTIDADARLRGESTFDHQTTGLDRHRGRFRFRVGATYDVTSSVRAGVRLTTTSDTRDPNDPMWDLGDSGEGEEGFAAGGVGIDRLYLEWRALSALTLTGGKFHHPFARPGLASEFAWDDDIQPAGVAAVWKPALSGRFGFDLRSVFVVAEERAAASDPSMFGVQANVSWRATDRVLFHLATSLSDWSSVDLTALSQGNTAAAEEFSILDTWLQAAWTGGPLREGLAFVQFLENVDDESGDDTGIVAGLRLGPPRGKGSWNVFGAWYDLETNAVFSQVAQNYTPVPGTGVGNGEGMTGLIAGTQYFIDDHFSVRLFALTSDAGTAHDPVRVRLDFDVRFR